MERVASVATHTFEAAERRRRKKSGNAKKKPDGNWPTRLNCGRSSKKNGGNGHGNGKLKQAREKYLDWEKIAPDGLPDCEYCNSMRRVRRNRTQGDPQFGKLERCPVCGDLAKRQHARGQYQKLKERISEYDCLEGRAERQTFDAFTLREDEGAIAEPVRIALARAKAFAKAPKDFLVFHGTRGGGKSHLSAAIANELRDGDDEFLSPLPLFFIMPEFLEMLRSGYDNGDYHDILQVCKEVDVLILDDLGTESQTSWAYEKVFQIINYRYQRELPTVVATNCELEELESRIRSRLADDANVVIGIKVPDYRQRERTPGLVL